MKILFVGNLELDGIVSAPSKVGYEIFSRTLNKYKSVYFYTYFQDGTKYSRFQKLFGKNIVENNIIQMGLFPFIYNIIKFRPDILQITTISVYYLIAFPLLKILRTKIFYLAHSINKYTIDRFTFINIKLKRKVLFSEKLTILFASKYLVLSEQEKKHLFSNYNINPAKIEIVDNGINDLAIKKNYLLNSKKIKIITVGALDRKEKGLEILIEFLEGLNYQIELTICNKKKHTEKKCTNKPNLKLVWLEPLNESELRKEFTKNDIYISFAKYESFSIALLEAMNSGLLFIATDRIGLTERFNKNLQEFVIPYEKWDLAKNKLNYLIHLSSNRKIKLSLKIQEFSNHFTWDKVVFKYFKMYEDVK